MSDRKKEALKNFTRAYPRNDEGFGDRIHGYLYLKYINLYVYYMKMALNHMRPEPDEMIMPPGEDNTYVNDLVKLGADHTNMMAGRLETNAYHAKVLLPEDAKKFFKLEEPLALPDLPKTIIPYDRARRILWDAPDEFLVVNCACRTIRGDKGCNPKDVCFLIGEPWVSFFETHNKDSVHRRISKQEAMDIIQQQHEAGNVQSAFFKDACGDRLYGMCNCCTCCCVGLTAHNYAKAPLFASSGYLRKVDRDKCKNCGTCAEYCHFNIPAMVDGKMVSDDTKCMGCSVCVDKCPNGAISLVRDDPARSEPLDLDVVIPKYGKTGKSD